MLPVQPATPAVQHGLGGKAALTKRIGGLSHPYPQADAEIDPLPLSEPNGDPMPQAFGIDPAGLTLLPLVAVQAYSLGGIGSTMPLYGSSTHLGHRSLPSIAQQPGVSQPNILQPGRHLGSAATTGIFRLGFSTDYTETTTVQLTRWLADAQSLPGFCLTGRVDAGGSAAVEHDWKMASLRDVPAEKGTVDHRTLHGDASIFTSYADFNASPALAMAWSLPSLPGHTLANLLDLTFTDARSAPRQYTPFPHAPGIGLAQPDAWETAGPGHDSANFELNGNYTDWFAPSAPTGLHDEMDFTWTGAACAATLQLSLLQTLQGGSAMVQLFYKGHLIYAGSPVPISATGGFQAGNPSIATISLANLSGTKGSSNQLVFDELHLQAGNGGFLVNGLSLTMADNTLVPTGGKDLVLSADAAAAASQILYNAPASITFGGTGASAGGDGVLDIHNFSLERGDQLLILKSDLVHVQITPTNASADLAVRFPDAPQDLILLRGAGKLDIGTFFHTISNGGSTEIVFSKNSISF